MFVTDKKDLQGFSLYLSFRFAVFFFFFFAAYNSITADLQELSVFSKRWVAAQLMADHVTDECIELLAASLFLSPAPFTPPR